MNECRIGNINEIIQLMVFVCELVIVSRVCHFIVWSSSILVQTNSRLNFIDFFFLFSWQYLHVLVTYSNVSHSILSDSFWHEIWIKYVSMATTVCDAHAGFICVTIIQFILNTIRSPHFFHPSSAFEQN